MGIGQLQETSSRHRVQTSHVGDRLADPGRAHHQKRQIVKVCFEFKSSFHGRSPFDWSQLALPSRCHRGLVLALRYHYAMEATRSLKKTEAWKAKHAGAKAQNPGM